MSLNDGPYDGKSQAAAARGGLACDIDAVKAIKYAWQSIRWNTLAAIGHVSPLSIRSMKRLNR